MNHGWPENQTHQYCSQYSYFNRFKDSKNKEKPVTKNKWSVIETKNRPKFLDKYKSDLKEFLITNGDDCFIVYWQKNFYPEGIPSKRKIKDVETIDFGNYSIYSHHPLTKIFV